MNWRKVGTLAMAGMVLGGVAFGTVEPRQPIGLLAVGDLSRDALEEIKAHMDLYLPVPVEILDSRTPVGAESLEGEAEALAEIAIDRYGVVGIVSASESITTFGAYLPAARAAVIHLTALSQDPEKSLARCKKESMRCAGLLLGLKPCPDTRCCMWHYMDLDGLDYKGGNFCPPCLMQLRDRFTDWDPFGLDEEESWEETESAPEEPVATPEAVPTHEAAPHAQPAE